MVTSRSTKMSYLRPSFDTLESRNCPSGFTPPAGAILTHHEATAAIADPWAMQAMHAFVPMVPAKVAYDQADFKVNGKWQESQSTDGQTWSDPVSDTRFVLVVATTSPDGTASITADASSGSVGLSIHVPQATGLTVLQSAQTTISGAVSTGGMTAAFIDFNAGWLPSTAPLLDVTVSGTLTLDVQAPADWTVVTSIEPKIEQPVAAVIAAVPTMTLNAASLGQFFAHHQM